MNAASRSCRPRRQPARCTPLLRAACALLLSSIACAQSFSLRRLTPEDDFPSGYVHDIDFTARNTAYFATSSSLFRARGIRDVVEIGSHPRPRQIRNLAVQGLDTLWTAGSVSNARIWKGRISGDQLEWSIAPPLTGPEHADQDILDLVAVGTRLYVVMTDTVATLSDGSWRRTPKFDQGFLHATNVNGELWLSTPSGIVRHTGSRLVPVDGDGLPEGPVYATCYDPSLEAAWAVGPTWFATRQNDRWTPLKTTDRLGEAYSWGTHSLVPDGFGGVIAGSRFRTVHWDAALGDSRLLVAQDGAVSAGYWCIRGAPNGQIWMAGPRGVGVVTSLRFLTWRAEQGLLRDEVTGIHPLGRQLVLAHEDGLSILHRDRGTVTRHPFELDRSRPLPTSRILDVDLDPDGTIWCAASEFGLVRFRDGRFERVFAADGRNLSVADSTRTAEGERLVAAVQGLFRVENDQLVEVSSELKPIRRVVAQGSSVFLLSQLGLARWEDGRVTPRLPVSAYSLIGTRDGRLLASAAQGIFEITDSLAQRPSSPLFTKTAYSIVEAEDSFWIGTNNGIANVGPDGVRMSLSVEEGLAGREANRDALWLDEGGDLWVGTDRGLSWYRRRYEAPGPVPLPRLHVEPATSGLTTNGTLTPSRGTNGLHFTVETPTFLDNGVTEVRYRLRGADDEWHALRSLGRVVIAYQDLQPGDYELEVEARHRNGGYAASTLPIELRPALTMEWWFWVAVLSSVAGLTLLVANTWSSGRRAITLNEMIDRRTRLLRESEARFRTIFSSSPIPQLLVDRRDDSVIEANRAAAELLQTEISAMLGAALRSIVRIPTHALEDGTADAQPLNTKTRSGHRLDLEIFVRSYSLQGVPRTHVTLIDVTERHRLAERIEQDQRLRAVGTLAGGVAHEFNNLLTSIIGFADLSLRDTSTTPTVQSDLGEIRDAAKRGADLVRRLRAFTGQQVLRPEPVELRTFVDDVSLILPHLFSEDIRLRIEHGDTCWIDVDLMQLQETLLALCLNAKDAMPDGGTITITSDSSGGYGVLKVKDTGVGMDRATLRRIFEPFFTTRTPGTASGLGLSSAQGTIHQSGGWIDVDSEPGIGTEFRIYLPASAPPDGDDADAEGRRHLTVMLADMPTQLANETAARLREAGHTALTVDQNQDPVTAYVEFGGNIDLAILGHSSIGPELARLQPDVVLVQVLDENEQPAEWAAQSMRTPVTGDALFACAAKLTPRE